MTLTDLADVRVQVVEEGVTLTDLADVRVQVVDEERQVRVQARGQGGRLVPGQVLQQVAAPHCGSGHKARGVTGWGLAGDCQRIDRGLQAD